MELLVGPVAHGGHCVARHEGRVVFVRHALPGERVLVQVTEGEEGARYWRAEATSVLEASPDRVERPCPYAGPGLCGGCDLQHVSLSAQRRWKAAVVEEQLRRLAGLRREVTVEPVPGDEDGLHWRTRMRYVRTQDGGLGLRRHRSREVVPIGECRIQAPEALVLVEGEEPPAATVTETVHGVRFEVAADGFWQAHRGAPAALVDAVLAGAGVRPGERVVDLYAGVGLFAAFLAEGVGPSGHVVAVEGDRAAAALAQVNLAAHPHASVVRAPVERALSRLTAADVVVLDPPRDGARRRVVTGVARLRPRTVVYVACDPAALARDLAWFAEAGYPLADLRAFDLFPMTHHVECVATLVRRDVGP